MFKDMKQIITFDKQLKESKFKKKASSFNNTKEGLNGEQLHFG